MSKVSKTLSGVTCYLHRRPHFSSVGLVGVVITDSSKSQVVLSLSWATLLAITRFLARTNLKQGGGSKHSCGFVAFLRPRQIEIAQRRRVVHPSLMLWLDPYLTVLRVTFLFGLLFTTTVVYKTCAPEACNLFISL